MGNKGYGSIPGTLFECITLLARALPVRSVQTFIELLIGAMLTTSCRTDFLVKWKVEG